MRLIICLLLLCFALPSVWADDHGSDPNSATVITENSTVAGVIEPGDDTDAFRFSPVAGQSYDFRVDLDTLADSVLSLRTATGEVLASNDDVEPGVDLSSAITDWTAPSAEDVFPVVESFGGSTGSCRLTVRRLAALPRIVAASWIIQGNVETMPEPNFTVHDPSRLYSPSEGVYSFFTSTHPDQDYHLRQVTIDTNSQDSWFETGHWPIEPRGENPIPNYDQWMLPWWEQYGYDGDTQIEHAEVATVAPSVLDTHTIYFHLYNNPGRNWAEENGLEPAMFAAIMRATAQGNWPDQTWTMDPIPVYYSDNQTFESNGPRGADVQIWKDEDDALFMTLGSWDPTNGNVINLVEMDATTGRIRGYDENTPGFYDPFSPHFHTIATFGEAAFIFHHDNYYYLFLNLGSCCSGVDSTYEIVVARSASPYGPYVDHLGRSFLDKYPESPDNYDSNRFPGYRLLASQGRYIGPGHTGVFKDAIGKLLFSFHYYDGEDFGISKLGLRELKFDENGWPVIVELSK